MRVTGPNGFYTAAGKVSQTVVNDGQGAIVTYSIVPGWKLGFRRQRHIYRDDAGEFGFRHHWQPREGWQYGSFTVTVTGPPPTPAQPLNISTRMEVLTDDQVLIGGFIITGNDPKKVVLRAIGPSLGQASVSPIRWLTPCSSCTGPTDHLITMNDNWKDTQQAEIEASGFQPQNDLESAIISTLDPGNYTAVVSGKGGGTGVGLVEGYDLDQAADSQLGQHQHARLCRDGHQCHDRRLHSGW